MNQTDTDQVIHFDFHNIEIVIFSDDIFFNLEINYYKKVANLDPPNENNENNISMDFSQASAAILSYLGGQKILSQKLISRSVLMLKFIRRHVFLLHSILYENA